MFGRSAALTFAVLLLGAGTAQAHRLNVDYVVLPGQWVQIESWFETGDSPKAAQVQVFRSNGQILTEGPLNAKGIFVFAFGEAEPLRVVVNAGLGHRSELRIPADKLTQVASPAEKPAAATSSNEGPVASRVDRTSQVSLKDVLIGVGFLLAVAAFVLSLRNARRLREFNRDKAH